MEVKKWTDRDPNNVALGIVNCWETIGTLRDDTLKMEKELNDLGLSPEQVDKIYDYIRLKKRLTVSIVLQMMETTNN